MLSALVFLALVPQSANDPLANGFRNPPASARPHTWWHWMNGNVTKEGITADLEAMKQAGIGGAQMFTVDQGIPHGPADYMGPKWRELTTFAVKEAGRLGLELCLHNCAGWSSSGGPWIKPEDAMQVLAWSVTRVEGPRHFSEVLPQPKAPQVAAAIPYYRDIALYAYRTPEIRDTVDTHNDEFLAKTGVNRGGNLQVDLSEKRSVAVISPSDLIQLTRRLGPDGRLVWDVPAGNWTILRMGHVPTGIDNHPAPPEGDGLEVDKLSKVALDHHWAGIMAKVIKDAGPLAGKVLNNALIDSYEVGTQNWTPAFREEFRARRGYDPLPYLPTVAGRVIGSPERTERFLWDLRRTIADLYADNYYAHFGELCHRAGMKFSTEPYGNGGFDTIQSGGTADIPMGEFWLGGGTLETTKLASSIGHIYGRPVIGAESFTGSESLGRWLEEPFTMKALGDKAFCNGINRFIFHRYAMQPWLTLKPGMTMGPWGTHLDRTQTWWTEAGTWFRYIARCQYLLQSGLFQADLCYYYGDDAPNDLAYGSGLKPGVPDGYDYDGCDARTLLAMRVEKGKVVLPSGMRYSVLVLPNTPFMRPAIARKIKQLVADGAVVYGPKPTQSPSLQGYPDCDQEVRSIGEGMWGVGLPGASIDRRFGKGRVVWDRPLAEVLASQRVRPDFTYAPHAFDTKLAQIHRKIGGADVYFVSNQVNRATSAVCTFRVGDRRPELWHPETGVLEDAPVFRQANGATQVSLNFSPAESVFVVFRKAATGWHLTNLTQQRSAKAAPLPKLQILRARYGAEDGQGADVTEKVRALVSGKEYEVAATNENFGDPVYGKPKRLDVTYELNGARYSRSVDENDNLQFLPFDRAKLGPAPFQIQKSGAEEYQLVAWQPDTFTWTDATGRRGRVVAAHPAESVDLTRDWQVTFPPALGAPAKASFAKLISWPDHANQGIRYFSGSATYHKSVTLPGRMVGVGRRLMLDLGQVKNFATVSINGHGVATLWKPPFALDITPYVHAGRNTIEIKVTNLWPNRIIGDEQLPPDVEWNGTQLKAWPAWLTEGRPRPKTGRITFETWHYWNKNSPLLESGLIGPVQIKSASVLTLRP